MAEPVGAERGTHATDESEAPGPRARRLWTVLIFGFVVLSGIGFQMRGPLVPVFEETFSAPTWQLGLIAPAGSVGFLLAVLGVGSAAGRIDTRQYMLVGVGGTIVCIALMAAAPVFAVFLGALLFRGVATGLWRGLDRPLLGHLYPSRRGRLFNVYEMFWAVGATLGPVVVVAALALGNWRLGYAALAVAFVPILVLAWRLDPPSFGAEEPLELGDVRELARRPSIVGMTVAVFLSGGVEGGLFTWLPYFAERSLPQSLASITLSVLIAGYVPGRLLASRASERLGYRRLVVVAGLALVPTFWATFFVLEGLAMLAGVAVLGALISMVVPTSIAFGTERAPQFSGPITAVGTAATSVGVSIVPAVMGYVIGGSGARIAMQILLAPLALIPIVLALTALVERS
ncbi:MAG: sugar MFS transporter [Haloarculaceae archaeon]